MTEYEKVVAKMINEFSEFQLLEKEKSRLMKIINVFLKVITVGKMPTFMDNFTTTIGYKIYTPSKWSKWDETNRIEILRHERIHMLQMKRYGLWFKISYLFLWFPTVFAYFRKKYEQEAYEESLRNDAAANGIEWIEDKAYRERIISYFTSAQYFWTWPFRKSIEQWYDQTVAKIKDELDTTPSMLSKGN